MQINDGHQCAIQQPEGLIPVNQKAEEPAEVVNERYEHQHMPYSSLDYKARVMGKITQEHTKNKLSWECHTRRYKLS